MSDQSTTSFADQFPPLPDGLEELEPDSTFRFECHPGVRCFNRCCHDLVLPLTPYDVMVLCRYLGMDGESFLERYATVRTFPETGFPLPFLNMDDVETLPCPFVGPDGCSVYAARPAACRSYPLGRGSRLGREGVEERHFLVREPHCRGFAGTREWTPLSWREDQGLSPYNAFNDRYMRLMCMVSATGKPLEPQLATLALVCRYQLDAFRALIEEKKLLEHVLWLKEADVLQGKAQSVRLLTMHAAKGLEFRAVFLPGFNDGLMPHDRGILQGGEKELVGEALEEERRLLYVALTRASEAVYVSSSRKRTLYGREIELEPSRFFRDMAALFSKKRVVRHEEKKLTLGSLV